MGIVDASKHNLDADLVQRLGNIAAANTLIRGGQDPETLFLATNLDADGNMDDDRPTMRFRFDVQRLAADRWRLAAGIDDATAYCRFWMDLELAEMPLLDPETFDLAEAPGFALTFAKPPEHERNPLARSAFFLAWRVDGDLDSPSIEEPLRVDVTVMGVELVRLPSTYVPTAEPTAHWALFKCHRGDQSFWLGLDLATGEGEIFPRRGEVDSYLLALDVLFTFT